MQPTTDRCAGKFNLLDVFEPLCQSCARKDPGQPERPDSFIPVAIVTAWVDGVPRSECVNHVQREA